MLVIMDRENARRPNTPTSAVHRPNHVGLIMDGNRRWARSQGHISASVGHKAGAEHLSDVLGWLASRRIDHVSAYVLSADNIRKRESGEVSYLFHLIENEIPARVEATGLWRLHVSGDLDLVPASTRAALRKAVEDTRGRPGNLTLAIAYDAREDMVRAIRRAILADATSISSETITENLAGGPVKDIDLVVRTGGDNRVSGFFPWQCRSAIIYKCEKAWPAFGEAELDAALEFYNNSVSGER